MRLRVHAPALISLAAACAPAQPAPLPWAIELAPGAPRPPDVATVRAYIRADGCAGAPVYSAVVSATAPMAPEPPRLANGTWGFGADALDAQCRAVAGGCVDVVVPSTPRVALTLHAIEPVGAGCTAPSVCVAGTCARLDGGSLDAGALDAGPVDGGRIDSGGGPDASGGVDAARCPGCVSAGRCLPGTTDSACGRAGDPCEACTTGRCTSIGQCCSGCIYSGTCRSGSSNARCGTGGAACANCNDTGQSCNAGTCS